MLDTRRHAPLARRRTVTAVQPRRAGRYSVLGRGYRRGGDLFGEDAGRGPSDNKRGHFRWLLSTVLAAAVGATAIIVLVVGSMEPGSGVGVSFTGLMKSQREVDFPSFRRHAQEQGLRWAVPKSDKLQSLTGTLSARFVIQDSARVRRDKREMIVNKSYVRLVARLAPVTASANDQIPAFNPYKLYGSPQDETNGTAEVDVDNVSVRLVDLIGGLLPMGDGQELDQQEVADLVARSLVTLDEQPGSVAAMRGGFQVDGADRPGRQLLADRSASRSLPEILPPNTSAFAKSVVEAEDIDEDLEAREVRVVKVARGQTLTRILRDMGGEPAVVRMMVEAARPSVPDNELVAGQEVHVTLVPSLTRKNRTEPVRFSVFGEGQEHKVTVARNNAGEFVASQSPIDERIARAALNADDQSQSSSLYTSYYHAALMHGLGHDTINTLLRIHAYETDFRRRVRGGDQVEWFFDVRDEDRTAGDHALGELLATTITLGGETQRFFRFRTPDGVIDYYDESGDTSRKFLMRRPVRGDAVRLASGFGSRRHPILGYFRPHNGVDWAGPIGTPIMAAGSGTIEEAGRKGEYGNYVRIRHANGYTTAYAHMSRIAPGISEGIRLRQGQVIGYIGNTGLSAGPHLHYEVLINRQPVDPMTIQVPRERRLTGVPLREFQKERARIEELMRRNPVSARIMDQVAQR